MLNIRTKSSIVAEKWPIFKKMGPEFERAISHIDFQTGLDPVFLLQLQKFGNLYININN